MTLTGEKLQNNENEDNNIHSASIKKPKKREEISLENLVSESKTSKIVTESITKKVIILILSILIMLPILDDSFYANDDIISYNILSKYISNYLTIYTNETIPNYLPYKINTSLWDILINETDENFPIVNITANHNTFYVNSTWDGYDFRKSELSTAISPDGNVVIIYSLLYDNRFNSLLNIIKTICLCILVTIATVYFESDVKNLVLNPLEIMIEIVDKVAKNPIKAKNLENLETGMKTTISKIQKEDEGNKKDDKSNKRKAEEEYEVKIIQSAIMKISALLAIGIGEAGNEIIKENLSSYNDLDPMVQGRKKNAIFGFCDIRGFPKVNEALQEHTMLFLNQIADIVHSSVDLFNGATNKNIGDAFLMVWKLPNDFNQSLFQVETKDSGSPISMNHIIKNSSNSESKKNLIHLKIRNPDEINSVIKKDIIGKVANSDVNLKISIEVNKIADSAVFGFLKVIAKINRDLKILAYRENEDIKSKIENFKVNMGFGLHMGWAIEGAIGSSYKIDASYLSPNVNMAARLEAATRQYGVLLLISGPLYDLLSEQLKGICRLIDIVTVKGSINPVKLYTIDINENIKVSKTLKNDSSDKNIRIKQMLKKKEMKKDLENNSLLHLMLKKKYFKQLLKNARPKNFNIEFKEAFNNYINGDWTNAAIKFQNCLKIFQDDGPSMTLLSYIKENNYQSPEDWKGFRALTSK